MNKIHLKAPATSANVGPGYDIFALALNEPYDEVIIETSNYQGIRIQIIGDTQNIPSNPEDNTAGLALMELFRRKKINQGINLSIIKNMISGGGLGTTGASAVAAIYGADKLLNLNLTDNEIIEIASFGEVASGGSPHADNVAAALLGGFVLIKSYDPISVLKLDIPKIPWVLAVIKKSQRTTRGFITYEIGQKKLKEQMSRIARVINALHTKDIKEFGDAICVDYIAEPVRGAAIPEYQQAKQAVLEAGAWGCNISGGGSSVFAVCPEEKVDEISIIFESIFSVNPYFVKVIKTHTSNNGVHSIN